MNSFMLDTTGYFLRDGQRFWPVGCNYTSASAGARFWRAWPAAEIRADLAAMRQLGFNSLRFFLTWEDFEPAPGRYDPRMGQRLRQFCQWCEESGLAVHPSLFTAWMSGGIFWPAWKGRRNLFEDPEVRARSRAYARHVAGLLRETGHLLAIDVGNEMSCLPDAHEAHPDAVRDWCLELVERLRAELPGVLVVPGNEQMMIFKDQGFRLTDNIGWDFYSAHGYPVPVWNECWLPGLRAIETQRRLPFYVKFLRAFGPVMLQEFGTIATYGIKEQRVYLSGMLDRAWRAGANGFLFWCWRDIHAQIHPYTKGGIERTLGLVDDTGRVKPGLEPFVEFARELTSGARSTPPGAIQTVGHAAGFRESRTPISDVGVSSSPLGQKETGETPVLLCPAVSRTPPVVSRSVRHPVPPAVWPRSATAATVAAAPDGESVPLLLPQEWYVRDNQANPGNAPGPQCEQYAGADSILDELGHPARIIRHLADARATESVIIPGAFLRDDEIAALIPQVASGRRLLWWSPTAYTWGPACRQLLGAELVDFLPDQPIAFDWRDRLWSLPGFPQQTWPVARLLPEASAEITDRDGRPLLIRHRLGQGEVWGLLPLCRTAAHPDQAAERAFATALIATFLGKPRPRRQEF